MTGIVTNVQRFSIHDGPGIRTTVFLKGCPLRCFWCHNPETLHPKPQIQRFPDRCIGCGQCLLACHTGAISQHNGQLTYDRRLCKACGGCAEVCYAGAIELVGRSMSVDDVMRDVMADEPFYRTSGGGVTLSGGEPALQPDFSAALLRASKEHGIHTAIETAAHCRWENLAILLPMTDLVLLDLKHADPEKHRLATGVSNDLIIANAKRLAATGVKTLFRVPVVPGVNDTPDEIAAIADLALQLAAMAPPGSPWASAGPTTELLPFHKMAEGKYKSLGMEYAASGLRSPSTERMAELAAAARARGIHVKA
jgi:pyruvate formate lyase activating enzyme